MTFLHPHRSGQGSKNLYDLDHLNPIGRTRFTEYLVDILRPFLLKQNSCEESCQGIDDIPKKSALGLTIDSSVMKRFCFGCGS